MQDTMKLERYYMKTRGLHYLEIEAVALGIRRIYNYTSDIEYMDRDDARSWSKNHFEPAKGEAVLIESAIREVSGVPLFIMSCIVFHNIESCNLYFYRHRASFRQLEGFYHLYN